MHELIEFSEEKNITKSQLVALYKGVGWVIYTSDPDKLHSAVQNSIYVLTAWVKNELIGLVRVVGDGLTIIYIQDILVSKEHRGKGIGTKLLRNVIEKYSSVRQVVLLTDNDNTKEFYDKIGMKPVTEFNLVSYIKINE
jgi:ribosomal protein S18 acetylase RimI-like enzyme